MPRYHRHRMTALLAVVITTVALGSGCVGPMACGPMGCSGPIVAAHGHGGSACGSGCNGCGERYFDEWINHPPSCTDPCDSCGNYQGQSCHACRPILSGFKSIWGYRCDPPPVGCARAGCDNLGCRGRCEPTCGASGCDSGCSSCQSGHTFHGHDGVIMESHSIDGDGDTEYGPSIRSQSHYSSQPTIVRGAANVKPIQPQRSRQIFQARDPNAPRVPGTPRF